ncbi:MAG: ABC transporter substrate-binding protein [Anaerolineae bacterium]
MMKHTLQRMMLIASLLLVVLPMAHAQEDSDCQDGFYEVDDATGPVCVPDEVERVVALEWTYAENVLALDVQPVGVADLEGYANWVDIPVSFSADVQDVGTRQAPNLELIAELEPDLIIGAQFRSVENYDELQAIAPVLLFNSYPEEGSHFDEMTNTFLTIADALNREEEGEAVLDEMFDYFERAEEALSDAGRINEGFILAQGFLQSEAATFRLFTDNAMAVQILEQIGLNNDWDDAPGQFGFSTIGIEGFDEVEDTNFFFVAQEADRDFFYNSALWSTLPFVQNENAYWLGADVWLFGGPLSAQALVDMTLTALDVELPENEATAAFPVTVEHKFGSTTIESAPQRVVAIGYTEQDYLLALGVTPVAVRSWYADESIAFLPWAEDLADSAEPEILVMPFGNLNYEAILALEPDMISAVTAGVTAEEYEILSQIAPTIAQSGEYVDFGMPWQEITRTIGLAVGQPDEAEALVTNVEALFQEARDTHPEFAGQSVVVAYNYGDTRTYGYYTAEDGRGRFFTDLGFVIADELNEIAGDSFFADISNERIDLLDRDVLVFLGLGFAEGGQEAIENDPLVQQLNVTQEGNIVYIPAEYDDALQYSSVLSLEYALEGIVPELAAVFDE